MKLLYGSQNFGYDIEGSDTDWMEIMYPTVKDIALCRTDISGEHRNDDGSITKIIDIRSILKAISKSNFSDMQFMYSKYYEDADDLSWFLQNRQQLLLHNMRHLFNSNIGYMVGACKHGKDKDLFRAYTYYLLLKQALNCKITGDEFVLCNPKLRELRLSGTVTKELVEGCIKELRSMEDTFYSFETDTKIYQAAENEIVRLLSIHFNHHLVEEVNDFS